MLLAVRNNINPVQGGIVVGYGSGDKRYNLAEMGQDGVKVINIDS